MLSKASVRARPSVLWCYKKELGFTSHRQKRMRKIKREIARGIKTQEEAAENPFELFVSATDIRYCYYKETHKILGQTFGMCVLQVRYDTLQPSHTNPTTSAFLLSLFSLPSPFVPACCPERRPAASRCFARLVEGDSTDPPSVPLHFLLPL